MMNRREALKRVGLIMGGTIIGAQAFLSSCRSEEDKAVKINDLFTDKEVMLMNEIGETIIPTTDTPGAKAADVGSLMAMMVLDVYTPEDQQVFKNGLTTVQKNFEEQYGHDFMKGKAEEKHAFLSALNDELEPYKKSKKQDDPEHYFRMLKELTLLCYFTSEIGSTQALRYIETPGRYEACIPYKKGDRAWAV